jgi:hypothetical protein
MKSSEYQRLLLPYDQPLPAAIGGKLPPIPQLWERAKLFFSRVINHIGSTSGFSRRWRLRRPDKSEILGWLEPAEKLARACILTRAFNFLLMTPEGRRLVRETPKMAMPEPAKPASTLPRITRIPIWHTHAPYARVLAERKKLEDQRAAERAARDRYDPANWGGGFRVVAWSFPEGEGRPPPKKKMPQWASLLCLSLDPDPVGAFNPRSPPRSGEPPEKDRPALILARRIEVLSRVIANPGPAVMRLARFIARLPREAIEPLGEQHTFARRYWRQGHERDIPDATAHVRRVVAVYCFIEPG